MKNRYPLKASSVKTVASLTTRAINETLMLAIAYFLSPCIYYDIYEYALANSVEVVSNSLLDRVRS